MTVASSTRVNACVRILETARLRQVDFMIALQSRESVLQPEGFRSEFRRPAHEMLTMIITRANSFQAGCAVFAYCLATMVHGIS